MELFCILIVVVVTKSIQFYRFNLKNKTGKLLLGFWLRELVPVITSFSEIQHKKVTWIGWGEMRFEIYWVWVHWRYPIDASSRQTCHLELKEELYLFLNFSESSLGIESNSGFFSWTCTQLIKSYHFMFPFTVIYTGLAPADLVLLSKPLCGGK